MKSVSLELNRLDVAFVVEDFDGLLFSLWIELFEYLLKLGFSLCLRFECNVTFSIRALGFMSTYSNRDLDIHLSLGHTLFISQFFFSLALNLLSVIVR